MTGFAHGLMERINSTFAAKMMLGHTAVKFVGCQAIVLYRNADLVGSNQKIAHYCSPATADGTIAAQPTLDFRGGKSKVDRAAMATALIFLH